MDMRAEDASVSSANAESGAVSTLPSYLFPTGIFGGVTRTCLEEANAMINAWMRLPDCGGLQEQHRWC
jgi:hypothetical protein